MLTLRSLRLFHPAADILVVDNASPSGTGGASYDSQPFFAKLNAVLPCGYTGCCEGEDRGVVLHGCHTSSSCECCGRVSVQRTHDVGARSKAVGSLREFGALAQAALNVHYAPAHDPHHIVLLQSTTGLKRPISFGALDEAACPFSFLHLPYSMTCCQSDSAADVRMRTARWGLSCSTEACQSPRRAPQLHDEPGQRAVDCLVAWHGRDDARCARTPRGDAPLLARCPRCHGQRPLVLGDECRPHGCVAGSGAAHGHRRRVES